MIKTLGLLRDDLKDLKAYSSARHLAQEGSLFLDANENPYDPTGSGQLNRYPEPQPKELIAALSNLYEVEPDKLIVSRGSDEVIDILIRSFCQWGKDHILVCPPTYGVYQFYADIQGASVHSVPLNATEFTLDIAKIQEALLKKPKIVFLCSPNNPTGNTTSESELIEVLESSLGESLIVVDEAYIEFSSQKSASKLVSRYENLAVMRTLSKAWGLAGLRCGSLIAHPELIAFLKKVIAPYPLPRLVYEQAIAAIKRGQPHSVGLIIEEREKLRDALSSLAGVRKIYASEANFLLVQFSEAQALFDCLKGKGIVLRSRASDPLTPNCLRISIGTPEENEILIREIAVWGEQNGQ